MSASPLSPEHRAVLLAVTAGGRLNTSDVAQATGMTMRVVKPLLLDLRTCGHLRRNRVSYWSPALPPEDSPIRPATTAEARALAAARLVALRERVAYTREKLARLEAEEAEALETCRALRLEITPEEIDRAFEAPL